MRDDLRLRCYRQGTQDLYLAYATKFVAHFMRPPAELGQEEVRTFQLHLQDERKFQAGTIKGYLGAIRFLYAVTLGRPDVVAGIIWPRMRHKLPDILAGAEIEAVFAHIEALRHRAIVMAAYGVGLRISEACRLCIGDIDSKRGLIHVRDAKRGRDRYVMLPTRLLGRAAGVLAGGPASGAAVVPRGGTDRRDHPRCRPSGPPGTGRDVRGHQARHAAHPAALVRDPPPGGRYGHPDDSGALGPCVDPDDGALRAGQRSRHRRHDEPTG